MTLSHEKAQQCIDALFSVGKIAARFNVLKLNGMAGHRNEAAWLIQEALSVTLSVEKLDPAHFSIRAAGILLDQKEKILSEPDDQLQEVVIMVQSTIDSIKHNLMEMSNAYNGQQKQGLQ